MTSNRRDYFRQYMAEYRAAGRDKTTRRHANTSRRFVGCDGEGVTIDGYHAYFMLTIGDQTIYPDAGNVRLTTYECLDFIAGMDPKAIYVGYFFDYDVTKILEDLPMAKLDRLVHRNLRTGTNGQVFPVDYMDFQVDYLPKKEFKVRRKLSTVDDRTIWGPWVVINDVGSFFQTSFLKTIQSWKIGTEDDWYEIEQGKAGRATFSLTDRETIAEYNSLEIQLLQQLMESFRQACIQAGYVPHKWQGPGLLAEAMFRTHGVSESRKVPLLQENVSLVEFGRSAFYGGRTETSAVGPVLCPVYQYDINSAYPYAMTVVPCLEHGRWEEWNARQHGPIEDLQAPTGRKGERFALVYGAFGPAAKSGRTLWYGLPIRTRQGTIVFPESGSGWYWSFEVNSARHQTFKVRNGWVYTRVCDCAPLNFVKDIYVTRQRIGKDGPGIVLKLGMNSMFGKTVQSIGSPKYANPIWGSFLTAFARTMINDFIHSSPYCAAGKCGQDVLMVATDSVTTIIERLDYPESEELGGWSVELHPRGMFIVQPGVYFGSSGKPSKTRGVPRTFIETYEPIFRDAFDVMVSTGDMSDGDVRVPQQLFCGIKYAVHRRNMKLLGQWIEFKEKGSGRTGKAISFDWSTKRALWPVLAPTAERPYLRTFPYEGHSTISSVPYSRDIGGLMLREELRLAFEGQPDWTGVYFEDD